MIVVDSSGWLEFFLGRPNAKAFEEAIAQQARVLVPSVCLAEVYKASYRQAGEEGTLRAIAFMRTRREVVIDSAIALQAGQIGLSEGLAFADSLILAAARQHGAVLWTQDRDFEGLADVRYVSHGR